MDASNRQQTGWIQLGDVAVAFLFAVPLSPARESEADQMAVQPPLPAPA